MGGWTQMNTSCLTKNAYPYFKTVFVIFEDIMAHAFMHRDTRVHKLWHAYSWVMAYVVLFMSHGPCTHKSHGTRIHESWHMCTSRGTRIHKWLHTFAWVVTHAFMKRATWILSYGHRIHEWWCTYTWVLAHVFMSHGTHVHQLMANIDMSHSTPIHEYH